MENNNNNFEKIKMESSKISRQVKDKTLGFIITAFGLVAGLAWNEAIQSLIKSFFAIDKDSVLAKFIYAIVMTLALVFITIYLAKLFGKDEGEK
ncbi:MAG: DUF5654 family protein [Candidatus Falkowbacteria bacterium]